jgi:recombination endonuclease VII
MGTRADRLWDKSDRQCVVCGDTYTPVRNIQKYCPLPKRCRYSNKARVMSRPNEIKVLKCTECGGEFTPRASDQYTCGGACPGKPIRFKSCVNAFCGKKFAIHPNVSTTRQLYCSPTCRNQEEVFRKYKMTSADYLKLLRKQKGLCLACGEPPDGRRLQVDHSHSCCPGQHTCGKCVRGLVHLECNTAEGLFKDNPQRLLKLYEYVKSYG